MPYLLAVWVLAVGLTQLGCETPPGAVPRSGETATVSSSAPPKPPERPRVGGPIVWSAAALFVAEGASVWRVPLPLGTGEPTAQRMPGPVGALVELGGELLVTVRKPGLLLRMKMEGGRLVETARSVVEGGGDAIVVRDGLAVVASPAGKVVGIDVAQAKPVWTVDVPGPRRVSIEQTSVVVAHAIGVSRFELGAAPVVRRVAERVLDPVLAPTANGTAIAYGLLPPSLEPVAEVARLGGDGLTSAQVVPAHVRAWRAAKSSVVAATDRDVLVLDGSLSVTATRPHACPDPRGVTLSADETTAYLACSNGGVAEVSLVAEAAASHVPLTPARADVDCSGVEKGPVAHEFEHKFGTADQIHGWLLRFHCTYPELTDLVELGRTHLGRPVMALVIGEAPRLGHDKPTFLINGAHHGSELMSSTFALDAIDQLLEHPHPATPRWLREDVVFVVVPLVNPDGNMAYLQDKLLGRKNGRDTDGDGKRGHTDGVDLNRNYPFKWHSQGETGSSSKIHNRYYRGPAPASEPETQAMMRLAQSERFAGSISFHTGTLAILAPYTIPRVKNPTPNEAWTVAEQIAKEITGHPEGLVPVKKNLYAVDGTDQDWFRNAHGTLALLVEGAGKWMVEPKTRRDMVFWIRKTWTVLVDRYLDGAAVGGFVFDAVMRPIEAEVSFAEIYRPEKEVWTSRCRDGRFDRFLSKGGSYTLRAKLGEHRTEKKIQVDGSKRLKTHLVMPVLTTARATCPTLSSTTAKPAEVIGVPITR